MLVVRCYRVDGPSNPNPVILYFIFGISQLYAQLSSYPLPLSYTQVTTSCLINLETADLACPALTQPQHTMSLGPTIPPRRCSLYMHTVCCITHKSRDGNKQYAVVWPLFVFLSPIQSSERPVSATPPRPFFCVSSKSMYGSFAFMR